MPLTSEQIEVQRLKFEVSQHTQHLHLDRYCEKYTHIETIQAFRIWLSAIESVEIELPDMEDYWDASPKDYDALNYERAVKCGIERQGYKVKP